MCHRKRGVTVTTPSITLGRTRTTHTITPSHGVYSTSPKGSVPPLLVRSSSPSVPPLLLSHPCVTGPRVFSGTLHFSSPPTTLVSYSLSDQSSNTSTPPTSVHLTVNLVSPHSRQNVFILEFLLVYPSCSLTLTPKSLLKDFLQWKI